ncbi:MAG: hypothetical protein JWM25_431 [Thermoleophilia bacterium]|nr:hypothetical protein [Thermoleophilia bacterium]MCZ4495848.1 hypothetical protein [Thermoleophilia bacterium]
MTMTVVTSAQNTQLKLVRALRRRRSREEENAFVVEGEDLVLAGLETGAVARMLLVDAERPPELGKTVIDCPIVQVESKLLADVSELAHPSRVIGIFELPQPVDLASALVEDDATGPWLVLDGLADPGNVGTVLRTCAALGAGGVVLLPGTADPFSSKAVRASMGACFRVPMSKLDADGSVADACASLREVVPGLRIVVLDANAAVDLWDAPLDAATLIVVGGEREGISEDIRRVADLTASIPQDPDVESVNAGVAASLALYEWRSRASR